MRTIHYDRGRDEEPGYDPLTGAYHCRYDPEAPGQLSQTVTEAVLALAGLEPDDGPPLSETVDPDALNRLFGTTGPEGTRDHLTFTHQGCTVTVYRDGRVVAYPPKSESDSAPTGGKPPRP